MDFINTNTFRDISNFVIWLPHEPFTTNILKNNSIIFCKTDYINYLFKNLQFSSRKYILITHSSDYPITENIFKSKPPCIKKWYAENSLYTHPDLISIPIGLMPTKGYDDTPQDVMWFLDNIERFKNKEKTLDIVYCNWNSQNNINKRSGILEKLKNNKIGYKWNGNNFTLSHRELVEKDVQLWREGKLSKQETSKTLNFYTYCEELAEHKFVISPPGNGEDTHRTWESLYVGNYPVVLKSSIFREFSDLPIIQVNDYSEVTYDLLYSYLDRDYNYEKLYMKYWKDRIFNDLNNL